MPDGKIPNFIIQSVPDDMHEEVIDFMSKHLFRDEVIFDCLTILEDPVSMKEIQHIFRKALKENVGLVALLDEEEVELGKRPKIVACNISVPASKLKKITGGVVSEIIHPEPNYVIMNLHKLGLCMYIYV